MNMDSEFEDGAGLVLPTRRKRCSYQGTISAAGRDALLKATQDEIRRLIDAEDFGVKHLASIAFIAEQQRRMLAELATQIREEGEQLEKQGAAGAGFMGEFSQEDTLAPSTSAETYGGGVLRQLVPLATQLVQHYKKQREMPTMTQLVAAAATARKEGLTELADHLTGIVRRRSEAAAVAEEAEASMMAASAEQCALETDHKPATDKGNGSGGNHEVVHS
jgi:hypothetical protein